MERTEGRPPKRAGTNPKYANAKRRNRRSSEDDRDAPADTGTPGGGLGAPDEAELKRDPEAVSEKSDTRTETDER